MTCQSSKERRDLAEGAKQHNLEDSDGFDDDNHDFDDDDLDFGDHACDDDPGVGHHDHDDGDDADGDSDEYENDYDPVSEVDYGDYAMIIIMIAKRRMVLKVVFIFINLFYIFMKSIKS